MKDRKDLQTTDGDAWNSMDELEFQISFDMPMSLLPSPQEVAKIPLSSEKSPRPTKPIRERRIPEKLKKHITKNGKKKSS